MDSKRFWESIDEGDSVTINCHLTMDAWSIRLEDLYQHFAERFRRENAAIHERVTMEYKDGGDIVERNTYPIVEIEEV